MKILLLLLVSLTALAQELPSSPGVLVYDDSPSLQFVALGQQPSFGDTSPAAMRLIQPRPNKFFSKKYTLAVVGLFGSEIYDAEVSRSGIRREKCTEAYGDPHSSRVQLYGRMLPVDGVLLGFSLLMRKGHVPVAPYVPLMLGAGRHFYTGSEWFTWGCM